MLLFAILSERVLTTLNFFNVAHAVAGHQKLQWQKKELLKILNLRIPDSFVLKEQIFFTGYFTDMKLSCGYLRYVYGENQSLKITFILCAVLNFILILPTFFLNFSVFMVTWRCKHLPEITRVLFLNLALADLLTACFSQFPIFIHFILMSLKKSPCVIGEFSTPLSFIIVSVSFMTSICLTLRLLFT